MTLSTNASTAPRVAPGDLDIAIGVMTTAGGKMADGVAYPIGYVGGWRHDFDRWSILSEYLGRPETLWRLVVGTEELEDRFVLRSGVFVELGEYAE